MGKERKEEFPTETLLWTWMYGLRQRFGRLGVKSKKEYDLTFHVNSMTIHY